MGQQSSTFVARTENDEFNDNLIEIERLAPILESLRDDEDRKLS